MSGYDFDRPFVSQSALQIYAALDLTDAARYGQKVKAVQLSNIEYKTRFGSDNLLNWAEELLAGLKHHGP